MRLRNFLIVLLAVLLVFAFASCKREPKVDPEKQKQEQEEKEAMDLYPYRNYTPTDNQIQVITITEGVETDYWNRDKLKIEWEEEVKAGDTITLKYRSERGIYQWDVRDGDLKWVYESSKNNFEDPVLGEGGWYSFSYTFADKDINGASVEDNSRFGVYFRGNFAEGDIFEIMDVKFNGEPLEIEASNIKSAAELADDTIADHVWTLPRNYAILLATGEVGKEDKHPVIAKVAPGSTFEELLHDVEEDGAYIVSLYSDAAKTTPYDLSKKVLKDAVIVYYTKVGVERTVKFDLNGGTAATAIADVVVLNGQTVAKPATIPTKEGELFAEWCTDAEGTKPYDFTKAVGGDLTLYARYGVPRTVKFNTNGGTAIEDIIVPDGMPVAKPADPENGPYAIDGWYLGEDEYNFATRVTGDITIEVRWSDKTNVTLNLNYPGSEPIVFKTKLYEPLASTDENLELDERIGFTFGGWYDEAACTTEHVFTGNVTAPVTLYAKWIPAKIVTITSTKYTDGYDDDKFILKWSGDVVKAGDVLEITFRTSKAFTKYSIRGNAKWFHEKTSSTAYPQYWENVTTNGEWVTVKYTFPEANPKKTEEQIDYGENGTSFKVYFLNSAMVPGAVMDVLSVTLNGEALPLTASNVDSVCAPIVDTDVDCYYWTSHTVEFDTPEGATSVAPATVDFAKQVARPAADPAKEGFVFVDWYKDAEFAKKFDFGVAITSDTTIYAKFGAKKVVTFVTNGGSDVAAIDVANGEKLVLPKAPTKAENAFAGWYTDSELTAEFDASVAITEDITLYAKWSPIWNVTLNYNYGETPETQIVPVAKSSVMAQPKNLTRVGYFFGGWYNDANCTEAHDFTAAVTADTTIYAKWNAPTEAYLFTATVAEERFQFRWHEDSGFFADGQIKPGDVFTLMIKFPEGNSATEKKWRLRTRSTEAHITEDVNFSSTPKEDGWYLITAVVPEGITGNGLYLQVYEEANAKVGDKMIIKAFAYNGTAIEVDARPYGTASTSKGAYSKVKADGEVVKPDGTPIVP